MSDPREGIVQLTTPADSINSSASVWWFVLRQELTDLWIGGRVFILLIAFTFLMSITAIVRQAESQLSLIPPAEMVFLTLLGSISFGLVIGLILGADSISGERERTTLEALLLTPVSRRQIVLGKFLAALSPWPVAWLLSIPYMAILARGDEVFGQAVLSGAILGTVLAIGFTGFGMLMSIWSRSNKTSLFVCLLVYILLMIPTQFPGSAQKGDLGYLVQQLNPLQATSEFLEKTLVNNRTLAEKPGYVIAAGTSAVLILGLLFGYAAPRLNLEGGMRRIKATRVRAATVPLIAGMVLFATGPVGAVAQTVTVQTDHGLQISVDLAYRTVNVGDEIEFRSVVTNSGNRVSPELNVAMNIVKTGKGDPVDPEDWSPQRTQGVEALAVGQSVEHSWAVDAILEGDYMVYLTVIPKPDGPNATSQLVSSMGIHLTVEKFTNANPGGVLPVAIGMPLAMILISLVPRRSKRWRKGVKPDSADTAA